VIFRSSIDSNDSIGKEGTPAPYKDIFAITVLKTSPVFVVIAVYHITGIV
jgi:hypothetical protein